MNSRSLLTGLALLVLFFTIINNSAWNSSEELEITYTAFLKKTESGDIREVTIQGDMLSGKQSSGQVVRARGFYDPTLIDRMRKRGTSVKVLPDEETPWYLSLLIHWGPLLLLVGVWVLLMRKMPGSGKIMSIGKSKAKKYVEQIRDFTFANVAGVEEAKEELQEIVEFLKAPGKFQKLGGKIPKGALMVGPPGTGKTLLAKAVAGEAGASFYSLSGSDFVEMFVGVGASRVRDLFDEARKNTPCIIFIDEIDAVGRHRGAGLGSGHDEREQTLNALLVEMDGFDGTEGIITLAATNRADILDPALLRPGRFDRQVYVGLPDVKGREAILKVHCKKIALDAKTDLSVIAKGTPGFSGAELANLTNEAALWAARQSKKMVTLEDLEWARDKVMMGAERKSMIMQPDEKEATAYHEAGHALVSAYCGNTDPLHKISIIPRGQALGVTSYLPEGDRLSMDRERILATIQVKMGGKAAEDVMMANTTTGVENDLKTATNLAYRMICQWGMSKTLGALTISQGDSGNYLAMDYNATESVSDELQQRVDQEVRDILYDSYSKAKAILEEHKDQLEALTRLLLEVETVNAKQFLELIGRAPEATTPETTDTDLSIN